MGRTEIDPITGLNGPGKKRGHLPGMVPVIAELSRIKSVIGIKCPKMKFFLEVGSRQEYPASHTLKAAVGRRRFMKSRLWGNCFRLMPPEFAGLYK